MYETDTPADVIARFAGVGFEMGSNLRFGKELCYNPFAPLWPSAPTLFNPYYYWRENHEA